MADHAAISISENRPLTQEEAALVKWLLEHGTDEARALLPQLDRARVVSRCSCGCTSVDFSIDGKVTSPKSGMSVVSDYRWNSPEGYLFGVFAYAREGLLSGIDLWSIDGRATASRLPDTNQLRPIDI
jgi:hypothetical protein